MMRNKCFCVVGLFKVVCDNFMKCFWCINFLSVD